MITFYIYRLRIEEHGLRSRNQDTSRREIILRAINERPSFLSNQRANWRIGNVQIIEYDDNAVIFALGKITESARGTYDSHYGEFFESLSSEASYTFVIVDLKLQICAIAHKSNISPKIEDTAKNLEKVLRSARIFYLTGSEPKLSKIDIPDEFLSQIKDAVSIYNFEMTFGLPNPFDVDRQFQKPMEELLREAKGKEGKISIKASTNSRLNSSLIERLTRSAVSSGNAVKARVRSIRNSKSTIIKSGHKHLTISMPMEFHSINTDFDWKIVLEKIREAYYKIRNSEQKK